MLQRKCVHWIVSTTFIVSLIFSISTSQDYRNNNNNNNGPRNWNFGDKTPLTGNQGNFYNPIFGTNGNPQSPSSVPGSNNYINTARPQPAHTVYPWSFRNSGQNNNYTPRQQPSSSRPSQAPPNQSFTPRPPIWTEDRYINRPNDRNDEFDIIDFQSLPQNYKTAFMSVEELIRNRGMISPPGPNSRNVLIVFDNQTQEIIDPSLESIVLGILPSLVPGTWRSMTYVQGCCSALRYHAANETLVNINGQQKRIVHFSKYSPPMYQFIPHGLCAYGEYSTNGHCLQGTVTMSLLVVDLSLNPPISFDIFNIPSYCNCIQY